MLSFMYIVLSVLKGFKPHKLKVCWEFKGVLTLSQSKRETKMAKSKSVSIKASNNPKALSIKASCGSCDHFERSPYYGEACNKLGQKRFSKPCAAYKVSPLSVDFRDSLSAVHMARLMRSVSVKDLPALATVINNEHITRKHGFYFGQPVFICVFHPGTHLNHYASGLVVSADHKLVYIQGTCGFRAEVTHGSVISAEDFSVKKAKMLRAKKITCPKAAKYLGLEETKTPEVIKNIEQVRVIHPSKGFVEGNTNYDKLVEMEKQAPKNKTVMLIGGRRVTGEGPTAKTQTKTQTKVKKVAKK